jgi:hypothetical protein
VTASLDPDSLNPYASPQPAESGGLDPNRLLTATFVVDQRWQRRCAAILSMQQRWWLGAGIVLFVLACALVGSEWARSARKETDFAVMGGLAGIWFGAIGGLLLILPAYMAVGFWNRFYRPPSCPLGPARLSIDLARITLECPSGTREWLLTDAQWVYYSRQQAHLFIKSADLVLLVEATADFGTDDYLSWSREMGRRTELLETD